MPAKNCIKPYVAKAYYHIFNRGVDKHKVFFDAQDYSVFLSYLENCLSPIKTDELYAIISNPKVDKGTRERAVQKLNLKNFHNRVFLHAFCLMPNHYHLLLKQEEEHDIANLMQAVMTRYTMYINNKYDRVGTLFQGVYKGAMVSSQAGLSHLSRYIHRNSIKHMGPDDKRNWGDVIRSQPSSYPNYLGEMAQDWVKTEDILSYFSGSGVNSYKEFVEYDRKDLDEETKTHLEGRTLE